VCEVLEFVVSGFVYGLLVGVVTALFSTS